MRQFPHSALNWRGSEVSSNKFKKETVHTSKSKLRVVYRSIRVLTTCTVIAGFSLFLLRYVLLRLSIYWSLEYLSWILLLWYNIIGHRGNLMSSLSSRTWRSSIHFNWWSMALVNSMRIGSKKIAEKLKPLLISVYWQFSGLYEAGAHAFHFLVLKSTIWNPRYCIIIQQKERPRRQFQQIQIASSHSTHKNLLL